MKMIFVNTNAEAAPRWDGSSVQRVLLNSNLALIIKQATFLLTLSAAAWAADTAVVLAETNDKKDADPFLTVTGYILVLLGALLGAGGGLRYFLEPLLQRRRLRKVIATGLWLSCYELRRHLEAIKATLSGGGTSADAMRDALLKIPRNDFGGRPDWFVKTGYFSMITAYKIAAFSAWMKIYQKAVLRALLAGRGNKLIRGLFQAFDAYKVAASSNTVLWYNYLESVGEWIIVAEGDLTSPIGFSEFCRRYQNDHEFLFYFDQLHMFIHFMARRDEPWASNYQHALSGMIDALKGLEGFLAGTRENLLTDYKPRERTRTSSTELAKYLSEGDQRP
jgi:hypothetical protein